MRVWPTHASGQLSRPLKIAYVVDIFDNNAVGGLQSSRRFVEGLRHHHQVTVIATGAAEPGKVSIPTLRLPGFQWIIRKNGFALGSSAGAILQRVLPGHDVVYIHYSLLLGYSALHHATRLGIPVLMGYHFQAQNVFYNLRMNWPWLNDWLARFFVRHFYNRVDHVVCPSQHALDELRAFGFNGRADVISNGLPRRFAPRPSARPDSFKDRFVVLMVSRLSREKRHDLVLQAIARSRHRQRILFVATGKGPLQSSLEKQVRALGIQSRIGYVDDCRLLELLNSSDLMVHASEAELEGMAVLEAIGCGLPVLIARAKNSAASQFAIDERFLFEAGAVEQLRDRLDYWIEHPEELAQAGQTYLVKSRQFGFDGALRQLESLLAKMAGVALAPSDDSATIASGAEIA